MHLSISCLHGTYRYDPFSAQFLLVAKSEPERGVGTIRFSPYPADPSWKESPPHNPDPEKFPLGQPRTEAESRQLFADGFERYKKQSPDATVAKAKLGRLALLSELRGLGAGRLLVEFAENWTQASLTSVLAASNGPVKAVRIQLHSQMPVRRMYER